jgi:phosphoribosyl-AMP cyclohydrolase
MSQRFAARTSVEQVEEGQELAPKFDEHGLIPAVTTDATSGELLMVGYMNAEALAKTIESGEAHYWSRSRRALWHKGATSGLVQTVKELLIDDDQDCVWLECNGELINADTVECVSVRNPLPDAVTIVFVCPHCGELHESLRFR